MEAKAASPQPKPQQTAIRDFFRFERSAKRIRLSLKTRDLVLQNKHLLLHVLSFVGASDLAGKGAYRTNKLFLHLFKTEGALWRT